MPAASRPGSPTHGGLPIRVWARLLCCSLLVQRIRNSLHLRATRRANFGFISCTSKLMFLVWFSNLKFLPRACYQCDRNFKFTTLGCRRSIRPFPPQTLNTR